MKRSAGIQFDKESIYPDVTVENGKGVHLKLTNGKKLLDLTSGATVVNLGHGNTAIAKAVFKNRNWLENTYLFNNIPQQKYRKLLLKEINKSINASFYKDAFFLSSGSEIIDCAIKASINFTKKKSIVSTRTSFHGRTINCMELTELPFSNIVNKSGYSFFFNYPSNIREEKESIYELEKLISNERNDIAALILEPYQGDGGLLFPSKQFFLEVQKLCNDNSVLFILDEIQSGFGRTGTLFYFLQLGIIPDLLCLGKAIGNGFPAAALVSRNEILTTLKVHHISNSFGGNPISMSAAYEVLSVIKRKSFLKGVENKGRYFFLELLKLKEKYRFIKDVRGLGLILGLELATSESVEVGSLFAKFCYEQGLLVMPPKGIQKNVIKISPPLIITKDQINDAILKLGSALECIKGDYT